MKISLNNEDIPVLTQREFAVLLAVADGRSTGYEIARQAEEDTGGMLDFSNGTLYPALKRMDQAGLIDGASIAGKSTGRSVKMYTLTTLGRMILEWRLQEYRKMVRLGEERL